MTKQEDWIAVAVVLRAHSLRGALMLKPLTRTAEEFLDAPIEKVHVRRRREILRTLTVERFSIHKGQIMAYFAEVKGRTEAESLAGLELVIPESERWELEEGAYYRDDLVGYAVMEVATGRSFGEVLEISEGPGHDHIVFPHPDGVDRRVMLPFVDEFVLEINEAEKKITVRLPEGLLEIS